MSSESEICSVHSMKNESDSNTSNVSKQTITSTTSNASRTKSSTRKQITTKKDKKYIKYNQITATRMNLTELSQQHSDFIRRRERDDADEATLYKEELQKRLEKYENT